MEGISVIPYYSENVSRGSISRMGNLLTFHGSNFTDARNRANICNANMLILWV